MLCPWTWTTSLVLQLPPLFFTDLRPLMPIGQDPEEPIVDGAEVLSTKLLALRPQIAYRCPLGKRCQALLDTVDVLFSQLFDTCMSDACEFFESRDHEFLELGDCPQFFVFRVRVRRLVQP